MICPSGCFYRAFARIFTTPFIVFTTLNKSRIILGHSYWGRGGAEVAAMWVLQALCEEYLVDIVTRGGWDLDDLNRCSGTNVQATSLGRVITPSLVPGFYVMGGALWHGLYLRRCRHVCRPYDLRITASRTLDWGLPAIHFLSDVAWNLPLQRRFGCPEALQFANLLRRAYFRVGKWLAGNSGRDPAAHDVFVANSQWCARIAAEFCRQPPQVIYPAVPDGATINKWEQRESSFLCLGRISPEKRIEQVIATLDQVRTLGHPIRLHLVGTGDDANYLRQVQRLGAARDWVVFHGAVFGPEKQALLSRCRYGISACDREAFGIATAEMVKAGIIPFVPQTGAQCEIVEEDALIFGDIQDAALKIDAVLNSESRQLELHAAMLRRGEQFDSVQFCEAVRELVRHELNTKPAGTIVI